MLEAVSRSATWEYSSDVASKFIETSASNNTRDREVVEHARLWAKQRYVANSATSIPAEVPARDITRGVSPEDLIDAIKKLSRETKRRLHALSVAHLEEEGQVQLSSQSLLAFLRFRARYPKLQEGGVVLTHEGNLRVVWLGENGERIALEFLPNQRVKYVALKRRVGSQFAVLSGSDFLARVVNVLDGFGALKDLAA